MSASSLILSHLNKSFGRRHIIKDLSLEAKSGEIFGFLGPNGAGKTTTIKMVMGFLTPDSGDIFIGGVNTKKDYEKAMESIGGIVENPEMYTTLSGRLNLEMYARLHGKIDEKRIDELVEFVGLSSRIDDKVKTYSLGMKQRLGVAQALLHRPAVLILDEPTNGLDPAGIKELRDILIQLAHNEGTAVIVSSHQLAEMALMCDRVGVISEGTLLGVDPIDELLRKVKGESVVTVKTDGIRAKELLGESFLDRIRTADTETLRIAAAKDEIPRITKLLCDAGADIYGIAEEKVTLEDAYLKLTEGGDLHA